MPDIQAHASEQTRASLLNAASLTRRLDADARGLGYLGLRPC